MTVSFTKRNKVCRLNSKLLKGASLLGSHGKIVIPEASAGLVDVELRAPALVSSIP